MSFSVNGQRMMHAAVNTETFLEASVEDFLTQKETHYGLKDRAVLHTKITDLKELKGWYNLGAKIGEGAFGIVLEVKEKSTDKKWAMKTVNKSSESEKLNIIKQEIQVLKLIQHPHIIYLDRIFESPKNMYMILELCKGDFAKIYKERKPFSESIAKKVFRELMDAVAYLHKYDIVHRDLKMENMLVGENPNDPRDEYYIKVTDFGLSIVKFGKGNYMLNEFCGTLQYMAPEIITIRSYTQMCDMWSVGIILYMLVMGQYPFSAANERDLQSLICKEEPKYNVIISKEVKDLVSQLLVKDPVNRITATEVLQHPWVLSRKLSAGLESNIFEKMKEWKSEMTVERGDICDWAVISQDLLESNRCSSNKQRLNLPKTNIQFDRNKKAIINKQRMSVVSREVKHSTTAVRKSCANNSVVFSKEKRIK